MAHIAVHRIEQIAARRLARLDQVAALAPFGERPPAYHWEFRRAGPGPLWPVAVGGRAGRIYMGEELPATEEGGAPSIRPPTSTRSPNVGALPRGVPEQLSYAMTVRGRPPAPDVAGVSTPPLPWPAQIVGASLHWNHFGAVVGAAWGLWATPDEWTNANNTITGESLIQLVEDDVPEATFSLQQNRLTPVPLRQDGAATDRSNRDAATQLVGGLIRAAGLRLTLVFSADVDNSSELVLLVTLRQLAEEKAAPVYRQPAAPRPPAQARTSTARARSPLPVQREPARGECIINPTTQLQRLQLQNNGEAWFRQRYAGTTACSFAPIFGVAEDTRASTAPSLAVALQGIAEGRAVVTTAYRIGPGDTAIAAGQAGFESIRQIEMRKAIERARGAG